MRPERVMHQAVYYFLKISQIICGHNRKKVEPIQVITINNENTVHIHKRILISHKESWNFEICTKQLQLLNEVRQSRFRKANNIFSLRYTDPIFQYCMCVFTCEYRQRLRTKKVPIRRWKTWLLERLVKTVVKDMW